MLVYMLYLVGQSELGVKLRLASGGELGCRIVGGRCSHGYITHFWDCVVDVFRQHRAYKLHPPVAMCMVRVVDCVQVDYVWVYPIDRTDRTGLHHRIIS